VKSVTIQLTRLDYFIGQCRMQLRHPVNVGGWVLLSAWVAWMTLSKRESISMTQIVLALLAAALLCAFVLFLVGILATLAMTFIARRERGLIGEHKYSLMETGLVESTVANESLTKWGGARALLRTRHYFYVRISHGLYHTIPRRHFIDEADDDEFWKALQPLVAK